MEYQRIDLDASLVGEAVRLCDEHVGQGLYTSQTLTAAVDQSPRHRFELIRIEGETVGYFYTHVLPAADIEQIQGYTKELCTGLVPEGSTVGILRSAGVAAPYRKMGLMDALIREYTAELFEQGCDVVLALAWERRGTVPMHNILRKNGFYPMYRAEQPWRTVTTLRCPECGRRSCTCDGVLYFQRRDNWEA